MNNSGNENVYENLIHHIENSGESFVNSLRTTSKDPLKFDKLIICGMGGSGISGDYVAKLAENSSSKRVEVNKNYDLPRYIDDTWNAVVISYSGNTEETLTCFHQLTSLGIKPVCITSNGKLITLAEEHNLNYIEVPKGIAPRAAFPYLFGSLYGLVAESLDLDIPTPQVEDKLIETSELADKNPLDNLCDILVDKFPIIIYPTELANVGLRFRCQINENSKKSAANFEVPEFSHNAIVGFDGNDNSEQAILILRTEMENERTSIHLDFLRDNMNQAGYVHEFKVHGVSVLEQHLALTWILDYISVKLAQIQDVDPLGVPSIDKLKSILKRK